MGEDDENQRRRDTPPISADQPTRAERSSGERDGRRRRSRMRHHSHRRRRSRSRSQRAKVYQIRSKSRSSPRERPGRSHSRQGANQRSRRSSRKRQHSDDDLYERLRLLENELTRQNELRRRSINENSPKSSYNLVSSKAATSSVPRSPEHKKAKHDEPTNFFEEFVKMFKGKDRESFSLTNNAIPDFDPLSKEQTMDMWLCKVDECAEIYNWQDKQTIHYALPKLTGHAKTWYQGLPSIKHSWIEWKRLLQESFPSTENYAELLTEMLNRRARFGESLELYYYSKINLLNRCKIFGKQAVDCIIYGVEDKGVCLSAQAGKFDKPEETLEFFKTVKNQTKDIMEFGKNSRLSGVVTTNLTQKPDSITKIHPKGTCFNCGDQGHMSYQCHKPVIKCSECNFLGHNSSNCQKKND